MLSILYCLIIATVGPLLLLTNWLQSNFQAASSTTLQKSSLKANTEHLKELPCQSIGISPIPAYCNSTISKEERIESLINLLTTEEKVSLLGHDSHIHPPAGTQVTSTNGGMRDYTDWHQQIVVHLTNI